MAGIYDLSVLKRHAFLLSYGERSLGPLATAPRVEFRSGVHDCLMYRKGQAVPGSFMEKREALVSFELKDTALALELLVVFRSGADLLGEDCGQPLTFSPIVPEDVTEKSLIFPHAFLLPDLFFIPDAGSDHRAELFFRCLPDPEAGILFVRD